MQTSIPAQLQQKTVHCLLHQLQATKDAKGHAQLWLVACLAIIAHGSAMSIQGWLQSSHTQQLSDLQLLVMQALQDVMPWFWSLPQMHAFISLVGLMSSMLHPPSLSCLVMKGETGPVKWLTICLCRC